jgi:hypothetical protein
MSEDRMNNQEQNFNWVEARAKCTPEEAFRALSRMVTSDVDAANRIGLRNLRFECIELSSTLLNVVRHQNYGSHEQPNANVSFQLTLEGIQITEHDYAGGVTRDFTTFPALSNEGTAVFRIGSRELHPWQLSREALEPLFFPPRR